MIMSICTGIDKIQERGSGPSTTPMISSLLTKERSPLGTMFLARRRKDSSYIWSRPPPTIQPFTSVPAVIHTALPVHLFSKQKGQHVCSEGHGGFLDVACRGLSGSQSELRATLGQSPQTMGCL